MESFVAVLQSGDLIKSACINQINRCCTAWRGGSPKLGKLLVKCKSSWVLPARA